MKFTIGDYNGKDVRVSLVVENDAEKCQLSVIQKQLMGCGANYVEWKNSDEGCEGICLIVEKKIK